MIKKEDKNKTRIFIVDDDPDYLSATKTILEKNSYECYSAFSAKEFLENMKDVKPDLILLDIMMETDVSGLVAVNKLRSPDRNSEYYDYSKIPILIVTSLQKVLEMNISEIAGTQLLPVDGFLEKPVKYEELLSKVKSLTKTVSLEELLAKAKKPSEDAMRLHPFYRGKLAVMPKCCIRNFDDFAIWYTPGVAAPCKDIYENPEKVYEHTNKSNFVAIVSDGTRVLGLGNIGPEAGLPVMEGKAILFKYLGGVDAFPICIDAHEPEDIITLCKWLTPTFGGINLEDISKPKCFHILDTLRKEMKIPVWHDDQQGTAAVTLAGLINALKIVGKSKEEVKIAMIGAGASNIAISRIMIVAGFPPDNIMMVDTKGILHKGRKELNTSETKEKWKMCVISNKEGRKGGIAEAMKGADVCIALSRPGPDVIKKEWVASMNKDSIVFVCANPVPEIWPWEAKEAGARIVATGRSDFPNQVNNSLGFPGIFRGTLDVMASTITDEMCIAAAYELAKCAEDKGLSEDYIIPRMNEFEVFPREAVAVGMKAIEQGIAKVIMTKEELYEKSSSIIRKARAEVDSLMNQGFIELPEPENL
ncbi:MAG: response regulator [Candidatus Cloacimonetes bacterium]|nr:response regulator [Candidatus Cloacimonadota bacterium]